MAGALKRCIEIDSTVATSISCMLASSLSLRGYCGSRMGRGKDLWGSYEALFVAPLVVSNTAKPALALPFFQLHWIGYDFATHNKHCNTFLLVARPSIHLPLTILGSLGRPAPNPLLATRSPANLLNCVKKHKYLSTWRNWKPLPGFSPCPATRDLLLFLGGPTGPTGPPQPAPTAPLLATQVGLPRPAIRQITRHSSHPITLTWINLQTHRPLFLSGWWILSALSDLDFHSSPELSKTPHENSET